MIQAGRLRHILTLQEPPKAFGSQDEHGAPDSPWQDLCTVRGEVVLGPPEQRVEGDRIKTIFPAVVTTRTNLKVTIFRRFKWKRACQTYILTISGITYPDGVDEGTMAVQCVAASE